MYDEKFLLRIGRSKNVLRGGVVSAAISSCCVVFVSLISTSWPSGLVSARRI